jgi:hypothetical protein
MEVALTAPITNRDKFECALREATLRGRVYPRWIEQGKIKKEKADRELALMQAIAEDYRGEAEREARKERLL